MARSPEEPDDPLLLPPQRYRPGTSEDELRVQLRFYASDLDDALPACYDSFASAREASTEQLRKSFSEDAAALASRIKQPIPVVADLRNRLGHEPALSDSYARFLMNPPSAGEGMPPFTQEDRDVRARLAEMHGSWCCPDCGFSGYGACNCHNLPEPQQSSPVREAARARMLAKEKLARFGQQTQNALAEIAAGQMNDHGDPDLTAAAVEKARRDLDRERLAHEHAVAEAEKRLRDLILAKPSAEPEPEPTLPKSKRRRLRM